jgi:hypothetical protein
VILFLLLACEAKCGSYERPVAIDTTCPCADYAEPVSAWSFCRPDQTGTVLWPGTAVVAQGSGVLSDTTANGGEAVLFCTCEDPR